MHKKIKFIKYIIITIAFFFGITSFNKSYAFTTSDVNGKNYLIDSNTDIEESIIISQDTTIRSNNLSWINNPINANDIGSMFLVTGNATLTLENIGINGWFRYRYLYSN